MMLAQQIPFDFGVPAPSLENFVVGKNAELVQRLRDRDFPTILYLWGAPGTGKTHLLNAVPELLCFDDAQKLSAVAQEQLFDAYNQAKLDGAQLVVTGDRAPRLLPLREDLRTRLGAGLVYELQPLSDEEKRQALLAAAQARSMPLNKEVLDYVLTHRSRDMRSLMALLNALDHYSLVNKRLVTLPLLKEILAP
ncbi:MAG: DnaA regulatory inactivator Hda [Burkholderiales bacterium]|jgi:DnaA family protein|nr:DnaA regulatory inactivator Hda [Burkholderiales bacterium]MCA3154491.1 DnaA regulatory inactivator Hda [Burkholderiales bacterium]MCA3157835.1 DnaA regulatory inactivator Hda [Burkholderiales bacterium]MCA3158097.1 DnaA regulatory inactivator Hda [Burkholderiales bacterium]MCA3160724.1 DnaA regulatory inactivator Hda [Burkholderiales bacterium]